MASNIGGQLLLRLLSSGTTLESLKNPAYGAVDENGNPDPGQVSPTFAGDPEAAIKKYGTSDPYIKPDMWTRMFQPNIASQVDAQNLLDYNSQIANNAKLNVGATNTSLVAPFVGKDFSSIVAANPRAAGVMFPDQSATGLLAGNTAAAKQAADIPNLDAGSMSLNLKNTIAKEVARWMTHAPEKEVQAGNARSDFETKTLPSASDAAVARNNAELVETPWDLENRIATDRAGTQAANRTIGLNDILNAIAAVKSRTDLSEANVGKALAENRESHLPLITATQEGQMRTGAFAALNPEYPNIMLKLNTLTGKPEINNDYINMLKQAQLKISGGGTNRISTIPVGNKLNIVNNSADVENNSSTNRTINPPIAKLDKSILTDEDLTPITRTVNTDYTPGSILQSWLGNLWQSMQSDPEKIKQLMQEVDNYEKQHRK